MAQDKPIIELRDVWKIYKMGDVNVEALRNLNIKIYKGEFVAIQGPSGSGKSTLLSIILGLLKPSVGEIIINDQNFNNENYIFKDIIGFVPQENYLIDDTIENNIVFFRNKRFVNKKKIEEVLKISNSLDFINELSVAQIFAKPSFKGEADFIVEKN